MNTTTDPQALERPADGPEMADTPEQGGGSILDSIRTMRSERLADPSRLLDLIVPQYHGRIAILYRYPETGAEAAIKAVERERRGDTPNARIEGASDLLVACCASVVGRDPETKALLDLKTGATLAENELPENVYRFDRRFAEAVNIEVPGEVKGVARHVCRQLFSPRGAATGVYDGDLSLYAHSNVVYSWLQGAEVEVDEELSGE